MTNAERAAFEAWFTDFRRDVPGVSYSASLFCWQAATAAEREACIAVLEALETEQQKLTMQATDMDAIKISHAKVVALRDGADALRARGGDQPAKGETPLGELEPDWDSYEPTDD